MSHVNVPRLWYTREMAKSGGPLPGRLRVIQARRDRGQVTGYWVAIPRELAEDLGWKPGDVVEFRRVGRHVELHKRGEDGGRDP